MFEHKTPDASEIEKMDSFRKLFEELAEKIKAETDGSREQSLALTKLEEASMWLNKGITW